MAMQDNTARTQTSTREAIRVEFVDDSRRIVHVGAFALPMRVDFGDAQPRVLDVEYAKWLGFARPPAIRDLIKRLVAAASAPLL